MTTNTTSSPVGHRRHRNQKGAEFIEFTYAFVPLLIFVFVILDIAWAVFAKSTLNYAVRMGVRTGITITGTQATAAGSNLVDMTKAVVQRNSLGMLAGSAGLAKIKVHFWKPPTPGTNSPPTLVDADADANKPLNIMQVSVEGFTLMPILPRIFGRVGFDRAGTGIAATSFDLIEPSRDTPNKGVAP
jgi:Flp pilus assembly protein TadG